MRKQRRLYREGKISQDRETRLEGIGFNWTPPVGGNPRKRKALACTRKMPLLRKESLESLSAGTGVSAVENNGFKDDDIDPEPVLPLSVPSNSSRHNCATESDDEIEEIGALIYDQVMQRRQSSMRRRTRSSMK